jgi:hypothetical protein
MTRLAKNCSALSKIGLALALFGGMILGGAHIAQASGSNNRFLVNYFNTQTVAGDDVITLINGNAEVPTVNQTPSRTTPDDFVPVCANIFVFDPTQDLIGCCSALISAGGMTRLPVNELIAGITSGGEPGAITTGTIKIVSTNGSTSALFVPNPLVPSSYIPIVAPIPCKASSLGEDGDDLIGWTDGLAEFGLGTFRTHRAIHGWITHSGDTAGFVKFVDEVPFSDTNEPDEDVDFLPACTNDVGSCCNIPGVISAGGFCD